MEKMMVNDKEFINVALLGKGKGGYSYLVTDGINQYVLKQIHHEPCSYYNFGNKLESEINDYYRLSKTGIRIPNLIDVDYEHERILKEYIEGPTVASLAKNDKVKEIYILEAKNMQKTLKAFNLNIDYFPTNFIVVNDLLYYIDYECNDYMKEWDFDNWGIKYWSKTLETENLLLRRFTVNDYSDLYEMLSNEDVVKYEPYKAMNYEEVKEALKYRISSPDFFAIENKENHKVIGNIYFHQTEFNSYELGYILNPNYQGKHLAKEASSVVICDAITHGAKRIVAYCDQENAASWHLLEALDFKREEDLKHNIYFFKDDLGNPIWKDTFVYGLSL